MGRDPACDIWVGAAHISRNHAEIQFDAPDRITVTDVSSNGTRLNGQRLEHGQPVELSLGRNEIDLGAGVTLVIARTLSQEEGLDSEAADGDGVEKVIATRGGAGLQSAANAPANLAASADAGMSATMTAPAYNPANREPGLQNAAGSRKSGQEGSGNGVFEKLAQRAAGAGGGSGFASPPTSQATGLQFGMSQTGNAQGPQSSTSIMDLGDDESAVVSRFGRAVLAFAITTLAIVLLFLVWWFLGNASLFS